MQRPDKLALGTSFLVERPLDALLRSLDAAFAAQEVVVDREHGPHVFGCRALRAHRLCMLDVCVYAEEGHKYLVTMRRSGGDRKQAIELANSIAAAAGIRGPATGQPRYEYDPDAADVARYEALLGGDVQAQTEGLCSAASMRTVLKTPQGKALAERVAHVCCTADEPHVRLTAMSAAVSIVRAGGDPRVFAAAASLGARDPDPLTRIQAGHLAFKIV